MTFSPGWGLTRYRKENIECTATAMWITWNRSIKIFKIALLSEYTINKLHFFLKWKNQILVEIKYQWVVYPLEHLKSQICYWVNLLLNMKKSTCSLSTQIYESKHISKLGSIRVLFLTFSDMCTHICVCVCVCVKKDQP